MHRIASQADLKYEFTVAWIEVSVWYLQKRFISLPRRLRLVLNRKGHLTKLCAHRTFNKVRINSRKYE